MADCRGQADEANCGNPLDFETGLNDWVNSHTADYPFDRHQGSTASGGTGPQTDAKGDKKGFYAYLEVSGRQRGYKAILGSPMYGQSYSDCVLDFYYHMKGRDVGTLTFDLITGKGDVTTLWTVVGQQGSDWIHGQTYIGRREQSFKINITATVGGSGVQGDIAIDEISFKNCAPPPICAGPSPGTFICKSNGRCINETKVCDFINDCGDTRRSDENREVCGKYRLCNFEPGAYCNWTQGADDTFDWTKATGKTKSDNTGPSRDHTYGTAQGTYMYMEASGRRNRDYAQLLGEEMKVRPGGICEFKFAYHMFGRHVNALNIYVAKNGQTQS
jgi:hypothetical protein